MAGSAGVSPTGNGDGCVMVREVSNSQDQPFIDVEHLTTGYEAGKPVLVDLSFEVGQGEFVCILGPSGCGKSTLLSTLSGLMHPLEGTIRIDGRDLYRDDGPTGPEPRLGFVFQDHRLLPWRTVSQNISLVLKAAGFDESEHEGIIRRYLSMLHIEQFYDSWPLNLSGGQRQRVSIARALAIDPLYILMDEPFSTLDEVTARRMRQELLEVWSESRKTIIFVTHSIREAVYLADRILGLTANPGRLYRTIDVDVPRVRSYEDTQLAQLEADIMADLLEEWGQAPLRDSAP